MVEGSPPPNRWAVFAVVAIGVLMATIDSSIVNVSLPVIAQDFGAPLGGATEWVVIAYLVVVAALLLTAGRVADVMGRRAAWSAGLACFTLASAACGAAPSLGVLVGLRALQGVGSAATMAVGPAALVSAFPSEQRGRVLGLNAVVVGLGVSLGPPLGGVIAAHLGWRWIFYVNVPLGVLGVLASLRVFPKERAVRREPVDAKGAVLLAVGLGALTGGLSFGPELGWTSTPLRLAVVVAFAALAWLVRHLNRAEAPLVDPALWKSRAFTSASVSLLLAFVATFAMTLFLPFYFVELRHLPADRAGLLLTPLPLTVALVSPFTGSLADRIGTRTLAAVGMLLVTAGLAWLASIDETTELALVVAALLVVGVGRAMFQPPNNSALMGAAPRDRQGVAAGVMATGRVLGQSLSVAFAGGVFGLFGGVVAGRAARGGGLAGAGVAAYLRGMHAALGACALVALASAAVALVRGPDARS